MIITYGCIEFQVERVYRWDNRAIYDESGVDYLYNHITIGVQAILNPFATFGNEYTGEGTRDYGSPMPNGGVMRAGTPANITVRDIQALVLQPRQVLTVHVGGTLILQSPLPCNWRAERTIQECDVKGGPKPIAFRVLAMHGEGKTMAVAFEIETFVNFFHHGNNPNIPVMLSNRWTMSHDIDELFYTTRTIQGHATFRKDNLLFKFDSERFPDDFRNYINHPIPYNFQRQSVRVSQSADATQLYYTITDKEMPGNLGHKSKIVKISGTYNCGTSLQDFFSSAGGIQNALKAGGLFEGAKALVSTGFPRISRSIALTVWGNRYASNQEMIDWLINAIAIYEFPASIGPPGVWKLAKQVFMSNSQRWEFDLANRRVSLYVNQELSAISNAALTALEQKRIWPDGTGNNAPAFLDGIPPMYIVFEETVNRDKRIAVSTNPRPANYGVRGSYLGVMMGQRLMNMAEAPYGVPVHQEFAANTPATRPIQRQAKTGNKSGALLGAGGQDAIQQPNTGVPDTAFFDNNGFVE